VVATVFTFKIADANQNIVLKVGDEEVTIEKAEIKSDVKLHLYSQPATRMPGDMRVLNDMLLWKKTRGSLRHLDLELNESRAVELDPPDLEAPRGLTLRDCLHLFELNESNQPKMAAIDSAECGQGGGREP
jgi:hypothetical protein